MTTYFSRRYHYHIQRGNGDEIATFLAMQDTARHFDTSQKSVQKALLASDLIIPQSHRFTFAS